MTGKTTPVTINNPAYLSANKYSIAKIQGEEWLIDDKGYPVYPLEPFDWGP